MEQLAMTDVDQRALGRIIGRLQFFRLMKGDQFERLWSRIELYSYASGETIFHKGSSPLAFYIIYEGRVRIHLGYRYFGLMRRMAHLGPADIFGEMAILEKRVHSATAVAEMPTKLFLFPYAQFDQMLQNDPDFAELIQFVVTRRQTENKK